MKYEIIKVMNNNVVWVIDQNKNLETVLIGKGIGFGIKNGEAVDIPQSKIEKSFVTYDKKTLKDYMSLVETIDSNIMEMCTEIILYAEKKLGKLSNRVYVVLTDHIAFAIERLRMQMVIQNPFLMEIKTIYKEEFEIGLKAQAMILERIGIDITLDEVGFIALHLNAAREHIEVKEKLKNTRLIKTIIEMVENELGYKIENDGYAYFHLINHVKASINRAQKGESIKNPLLDSIKKEFKDSYSIAEKVKTVVEKELGAKVSEDEIGYMAIHIARIRQISN